ncbi:hypothetical protein GGH19_003779 [Coemansia sp. RSA 1807]|nr:hypothetical protein GGH19_003779 [Coemansia sp. RSA 1807]
MSHTKVHFPKLAHFYTNNDSDEFPILATCVFPRHIETLDIKAQTKLLRLLVLATWPQTEHLKLTLLPSYTDMDASLFGCIRHLLKSAETSKAAEVAISNDSFVVEQELFAGIRVTHLRLSPPVGFETMVSLVDNMPSLVNLCVYDFESSTGPDKIVDCSDRLAPFSSKLQQLSIDCLDDEYPPVRTINAVVYMAKRLTQLKMVKVPISVISVVGLLNKERSMYPHLNNVLFKFTDDGYLDTRTLDIFGNNKY